MGYFFFLTICVSWLMPGDWMGTNHILCQQNYKKEASELKDTNWQFHPVESPCVWTSGVKQSGGKTGSRPFIPLIIIFFSPFENGSTGQHQQWQDMKHWPYGKKKPVMKHNESLGRTTEIAKIASLTLFIFVNWLKKSEDLEFFFTMLCSVRDLDAKHRRASIHWARSRAAFLKVLTTCFNDEIILKKKESIHTVRLRKKNTKKHTYDLCEERMKQRNSADGSLLICPGETALYCVEKKRAVKRSEHQRSLNHRELLCRQPKAYLRAATSHSHMCLEPA